MILAEVFDRSVSAPSARFLNICTLNIAGSGNSTLTAGGVVRGSGTITLLIRGVGPELARSFGVTGVLADPQIMVRGADTTNDDWDGSLTDIMASVGVFPLAAGQRGCCRSRDGAAVSLHGRSEGCRWRPPAWRSSRAKN